MFIRFIKNLDEILNMPIKDKIVGNLIKYILIPRNEIIDQSGFIINKLSLQKEITNLREILLP